MTFLLALLLAIQTPSERIDWLLQHAGELQSQQQRHADLAIPFLEEAVDLAQKSHDGRRESRALVQLGRAKHSTHHLDDALAALVRALDLARATQEQQAEIDALAGLAMVNADRGNFIESQKYFRAILDIGTRDNDASLRIRGLNGIAAIDDHRGRSAEAARYARIALAELDAATREGKTVTPQAYFSVPYNLGKALSESGEYAAAAQYFERARSAAERMNMISGIWHVLHETAEMYRAEGDLNTAVRYYQRALAEAHRLESHDPESMTLRALGACAEARGDFAAALAHYHESLALFENYDFASEVPQTLTMLAHMQFMTGDRDGARASLDRAAALSLKMNQPLGSVLQKLESGRERFESGDLSGAKSEYLAAIDLTRNNDLYSFSANALLGLADIERAEGNVAGALQHYSAAADAIDATRSKIPSIEMRSMYVSATHAIYEHWLDALLQSRQYEHAFLVLERERSRNLLDALMTGAMERSPQVVPLNRSVSALQVALTSPSLTPVKRRLYLNQLDDAERRLDFLQTSIQPPPRLSRDLRSLQQTLRDDEAWIEFTTRPNSVIVFLLTRNGLAVTQRATTALESRIEFFNDLLDSVNSEEALRPGSALSADLLADVMQKMPATTRRLILGVAGDLAALPFDALPDPANGVRPILTRFEIAYAPSLSTLAEMRSRRSSSPHYDLLGVAPLAGNNLAAAALPVYRSTALAPLPWSGREIAEVAQLVSGHADQMVGFGATEEAFKKLPLRDYKVIHLATHALLDPQFPSRSGIVFTRGSAYDDGWLQMREIYQLDLSGQLVVLSACQTAFGAVSSAEGMHSLAQAFTYAGANSVVATLWKVEDLSAAKMVEKMYAAIGHGQTVSAALRTAQLAAAGAHPYRNAREWAGWVATGDPAARPEISRSMPLSPWIAGAVIVAAFLWGAAALRRA
jgi:CHAT domain-containing protein